MQSSASLGLKIGLKGEISIIDRAASPRSMDDVPGNVAEMENFPNRGNNANESNFYRAVDDGGGSIVIGGNTWGDSDIFDMILIHEQMRLHQNFQ